MPLSASDSEGHAFESHRAYHENLETVDGFGVFDFVRGWKKGPIWDLFGRRFVGGW